MAASDGKRLNVVGVRLAEGNGALKERLAVKELATVIRPSAKVWSAAGRVFTRSDQVFELIGAVAAYQAWVHSTKRSKKAKARV